MRFSRTALAVLLGLLAASAAAAQTGGLTIVVTDGEGSPLPGATVTISHETSYVKTTAVLTDKNGLAEFPVLRAGAGYSITVAFPGFNTIREDGIRVPLGEQVKLPISMIEEFQEKVTVKAQRQVVDLEKTEITTKFSEDFISDLPVPGRFYQNVLTMAPGVQDQDGDGNPTVHGSRSRDFQAMVGGVPNVDPLTGRWMSQVNPNSIEEMEVITAGAGVEFGRAQGGFANIVQKQGSNAFEGTFDFIYRTSRLDGDGHGHYTNLPNQDFEWVNPSIQLTGPVVKDKLWYRVDLEDRNIDVPVNVGGGLEVQTFDEQTRDVQFTWQVSPRNKLQLNFRDNPREYLNLGVSSVTRSDASFGIEWDGPTYSLTWVAPFSPKIYIESLVSWQDVGRKEFPNARGQLNACTDASSDLWLQEASCLNLDTFRRSGSWFVDNNDQRQRLQVRSQATVFGSKLFGFSHQFKMGIEVANERYFRHLERRASMFYYVATANDEQSNQSGSTAVAVFLPTVRVPQTDDVRATNANWAMWLEDQFKPRQNLTVTLGVRVDHEEITAEGRRPFDPQAEFDAYSAATGAHRGVIDSQTIFGSGDRTALAKQYFTGWEDVSDFQEEMVAILCKGASEPVNCAASLPFETSAANGVLRVREADDQFITNTNFSPFLSLAWSPWSNGKTLFRATTRRYYNPNYLTLPLQELEPSYARIALTQDLASEDDQGNPPAIQFEGSIYPVPDVTVVDRELKTPYQDEFTFSFERQLWAETQLRLSYIKRNYRDQIQDRNINVNTGDYGQCVLQATSLDRFIKEAWRTGTRVDPFTGETYFDNDPGPGDGRLDDCVGKTINVTAMGEDQDPFVVRPDGVPDLYRLNPYFGDIYFISNINSADYHAYQLELDRRLYRGWQLTGSYVWSKAKGDGEDYFQGLGDDPSLNDTLFGYQSNDQRHVVKLSATTITPWGIRLGTSASWQSGTPYSIIYQQASRDAEPFYTEGIFGDPTLRPRNSYPAGQRNTERNPAYWNVNLRASKELNLGRDLNMQVAAEIFNLFDDGTVFVYNNDAEAGQQVNGNNETTSNFGRRWQLGLTLTF